MFVVSIFWYTHWETHSEADLPYHVNEQEKNHAIFYTKEDIEGTVPLDSKWAIQSPAAGAYLEGKNDPWASVALFTKDSLVRFRPNGAKAEQILDTDSAPLLQVLKVSQASILPASTFLSLSLPAMTLYQILMINCYMLSGSFTRLF